jgi:hypothetical protein
MASPVCRNLISNPRIKKLYVYNIQTMVPRKAVLFEKNKSFRLDYGLKSRRNLNQGPTTWTLSDIYKPNLSKCKTDFKKNSSC